MLFNFLRLYKIAAGFKAPSRRRSGDEGLLSASVLESSVPAPFAAETVDLNRVFIRPGRLFRIKCLERTASLAHMKRDRELIRSLRAACSDPSMPFKGSTGFWPASLAKKQMLQTRGHHQSYTCTRRDMRGRPC
jgi:hypothetical protein